MDDLGVDEPSVGEPRGAASAGYLAHLQLLDSALPVGSFAHSFGLEAAVAEGAVRDADSLHRFALVQLRGRWAPVDACVMALPWALARGDITFEELCDGVQRAHLAVAASRSRAASVSIGRRLLKLAAELHPTLDLEPLASAARDGALPPAHQLAHGWVTHRLGVERDRAAEAWLYAAVSGCVNAAVRLMPLGQTRAQVVIARVAEEIPARWREVRGRPPLELAGFAPLADEHAMRHAQLGSRLFMS